MSEENKETPAPVEAPPAEPPPASTRDTELEELRRRLDDVEVKADAALLMHLEDDIDEEAAPPAERTEVEERVEAKDEKKTQPEEKKSAPPAERHSGMFL